MKKEVNRGKEDGHFFLRERLKQLLWEMQKELIMRQAKGLARHSAWLKLLPGRMVIRFSPASKQARRRKGSRCLPVLRSEIGR